MKSRTILEYGAEKPTRRGVLGMLATLLPAGWVARDATLRTTALTGQPVSKTDGSGLVTFEYDKQAIQRMEDVRARGTD